MTDYRRRPVPNREYEDALAVVAAGRPARDDSRWAKAIVTIFCAIWYGVARECAG